MGAIAFNVDDFELLRLCLLREVITQEEFIAMIRSYLPLKSPAEPSPEVKAETPRQKSHEDDVRTQSATPACNSQNSCQTLNNSFLSNEMEAV